MPLRPDEIENREFASSLRGFDKHEVRAFLRRVATDVEELETQLTTGEFVPTDGGHEITTLAPTPLLLDEDRFAALGDRIANLLRQAYDAAAETQQQSEQKALQLRSTAEDELERARVDGSRLREEAEAAVLGLRSQAEDESNRLREEAQHLRAESDRLHAESVAVRTEAEEYVNQLRNDADEYAGRVRFEAEQYAGEVRGQVDSSLAETERFRGEAEHVRREAENDAVIIRDRAETEGAARLDERRTLIEQSEAEIASEREAALAEVSEAREQVSGLLEEARAQSEFIKREAEEIIRAKVRTNIDQAQRRIDVLRNTETSSRNRILTAQRELEAALNRLDSESAPAFGTDVEEAVLVEAEQRAIEAEYPPFRSERLSSPYATAEGQVIEGQVIEGEVIEDPYGYQDDGGDDFSDDGEFDQSEAPETFYRPSADAHIEGEIIEDLEDDDPEVENAAAPENEDALARLVREAMQRVVEDARNENR